MTSTIYHLFYIPPLRRKRVILMVLPQLAEQMLFSIYTWEMDSAFRAVCFVAQFQISLHYSCTSGPKLNVLFCSGYKRPHFFTKRSCSSAKHKETTKFRFTCTVCRTVMPTVYFRCFLLIFAFRVSVNILALFTDTVTDENCHK